MKQADAAKGGRKNGDRYERLLGNVIFTQNNTTIYCDSAHFFKRKNSLEAFGKVKILEGDSVTITGRRLEYDGDSRVAKIRNNVVFTNASATLYTDNLDYMRSSNIAYYFKGGKLVDSATVLNSEKGYYNANTSLATFQTNVKVTNPDYTMYADSLRYNTRSKIIYFVTRTRVVNKDSSTFEYEKGVYNTITRKSDLIAGTAETENYTLVGKRYDLDAARDIAKVRGDVVLTYKEENLVIYGQASDHFKRKGITKIYDRAYVAKINDEDTLFIRADTLVSIDSPDPSKRKILAYNNVRLFKTDMQGSSDSLEYRYADSTIYFYQEPILWSEGNQLTADSIRFLLKNNTIHKMYLIANAFVINRDTLLNFNQIKGRKMTADINDGKISKVLVEGNGESLYFAIDDDNTTMMGVNKIICSNIIIRFKEGGVHNLSFLVKPEASFIPPHMLKKEDKTLKGFSWRYNEKPTRKTVIPKPAILPK
ncbi:MAG TPA: OstA-like protein [Chryseosolibacter sp.]|nr:OstA-like protein [Chryseosolibacter sp.]